MCVCIYIYIYNEECKGTRDYCILYPAVPCCCSAIKSRLISHNSMDCSTPGFPGSHCLPEFAQIHVH